MECIVPDDDWRFLHAIETMDQEVGTDPVRRVDAAGLGDGDEAEVVEVRLEYRLVSERGVAAQSRALVDVVIE